MGAWARPPFPKSLREFLTEFGTEEACQEYLAACRWPDGFLCPRCGHRHAYTMEKRLWQCVACRHQVSLTSGTVLHNTRTPLTVWFWAAYLMTTHKRGVSAVLLQRQLGLSRYVHKLRRAMVNAAREPLHGEVEVDDSWIGGQQAGLRGRATRDVLCAARLTDFAVTRFVALRLFLRAGREISFGKRGTLDGPIGSCG